MSRRSSAPERRVLADGPEIAAGAPARQLMGILRARLTLLIPGGLAAALMVLWAVHDGGYDSDTWYWGALVVLGLLAAVVALGLTRRRLPRAATVALVFFAAYVGWSYLSMTWASTPGWALEGSNRVLLYALVFALFLLLPWRADAALALLTTYALAIGVIAIVLLLRFSSHDHLGALVIDGRLAAPTGYFNSTVALFMIDALLGTVLATRRELPGIVRGLLIGTASASLQLCVMGQSRGWLFTLPAVLLITCLVVRDRLRVAVAAVMPVAAVLIPVHQLLGVFHDHSGVALNQAASSAGRTALLLCVAAMVLGTLIAWAETLRPPRNISRSARMGLGTGVAAITILLCVTGTLAVTHGDPVSFVKRQWHGFIHPSSASSASTHFVSVGTGRYDFWRIGLDATARHPLGGLGQDNFADYYVPRRRTYEEPKWTHSLELRLLVHTGIVGTVLFVVFMAAALTGAVAALRRGTTAQARGVAAAALLPLVVWLVHGSVDWFWEVPALSGPALGFLGMSVALGVRDRAGAEKREAPKRGRRRSAAGIARWLGPLAGVVAVAAGTCVLGFPYLSVREVSRASDNRNRNPLAALSMLKTAADLNPLAPEPTRLGGLIALTTGRYNEAQQRFNQTIAREPGGWFGWLGAGLTASTLGNVDAAAHDFQTAVRINPREETVQVALERVRTVHPLTPAQAVRRLQTD